MTDSWLFPWVPFVSPMAERSPAISGHGEGHPARDRQPIVGWGRADAISLGAALEPHPLMPTGIPTVLSSAGPGLPSSPFGGHARELWAGNS